MRLHETFLDLRQALNVVSEDLYIRASSINSVRIIFILLLVFLSVSPALFDAAVTVQFLGYDVVAVLLEVQIGIMAAFFAKSLISPSINFFYNALSRVRKL